MTNLKINILPSLLAKLNVMSSEYNIEIGGYLTGVIKNNEIFLRDILIPEQTISVASVSINGQDQLNLRRKYGDKCKEIIGHWHSHHNMGCFWSGTDENNMNTIMTYKNIFVFMVSSKGNHLLRVSIKEPFRWNFNECELYLKSYQIDELRNQVSKLIEDNRHLTIAEDEEKTNWYDKNSYEDDDSMKISDEEDEI